jgi:hypothetical protein
MEEVLQSCACIYIWWYVDSLNYQGRPFVLAYPFDI